MSGRDERAATGLTADEREALLLAFIEAWCADLDPEEAAYVRTMPESREAAEHGLPHMATAVETILAAHVAEARAEAVRETGERIAAAIEADGRGKWWSNIANRTAAIARALTAEGEGEG